jgi:hypothetical protein
MNNEQSMVHWVEKGEGKYSHDFRVFDRYLDLAQKYLKPDVVCLYAFGGKGASVLNPADGTVKTIGLPDWKTPEAEAFWKPVLDEAMARLEKRGLAGHAVLGLVGDRWPKDKQPIEVLSKVRPDLKWSQFAHYGGQKGAVYDHPYGYVMSVWGVQFWGKFNAKRERAKVPFGGAGLPFKTSQHYRSSPLIDLRPIAPRGAMRLAPECAMGGRCAGVGPVGVDYWIVELGKRRRTDSIEGGGNLRMTHLSASALLAPGPEGPISTARFEILRQGIQECEARGVLELTLADETRREKLGKDLVDRCRRVLKSRADALTFLKAGERRGQRQGWKWFESSGWERRAGELFAAAAEVEEVLRGE